MGKREQNPAVEQVMDELNEELSAVLNVGTEPFAPELVEDTALSKELAEPLAPVIREESSALADSESLSEDLADAEEPISSEEPSEKPSKKSADALQEGSALLPEEGSLSEELSNMLSFEPGTANKKQLIVCSEEKAGSSLKENEKAGLKKKRGQKKKSQKQQASKLDGKSAELQDDKKDIPAWGGGEGSLPADLLPEKPISNPLMGGIMGKITGRYENPADQSMVVSLKHSENLRVAQDRIVALEAEIDRLRKENEELIATGDIFRDRLDKVVVQNDNLKKTHEESREEFQEEKKTLMNTLSDQGREMDKLTLKNKELEKRLSNNILQIRVRERELENRIELMKLDSQTLIREKDQYILDLKRQMDRIKMDLETQKNKYNETQDKLKGQSHQTRRAARGLQMALHILKGDPFSAEEKEQETDK